MERDANRIYTDQAARAKYDSQLQREFKEIGDMIDGARKVPLAADKLLKLMELEITQPDAAVVEDPKTQNLENLRKKNNFKQGG